MKKTRTTEISLTGDDGQKITALVEYDLQLNIVRIKEAWFNFSHASIKAPGNELIIPIYDCGLIDIKKIKLIIKEKEIL